MLLPHPELLDDFHPLASQGLFAATLKGHGLYSTFEFVLRLSPAVHRKLASMPNGIVNSGMIDLEGLQAFSTYLHETIHWWQHVGSTYGLMLSMTYPVQSHANYDYLKSLISSVGFKKSVRQLAYILPRGGYGTPSGLVNIIINNHFDMEAFRGLTISHCRRIRSCMTRNSKILVTLIALRTATSSANSLRSRTVRSMLFPTRGMERTFR